MFDKFQAMYVYICKSCSYFLVLMNKKQENNCKTEVTYHHLVTVSNDYHHNWSWV